MPVLTLGALYPTSGTLGDVGAECLEAVRAAVRRHTPSAWTVRILEGDPSDPERAAREAERLIRAGARVLTGTLLSHLCLPASEVAEREGALYWEAIASADEITTRGLRRTFRLDGSATRYGAAAVDLIADTLAPLWRVPSADLRIATIAEMSAFPLSFAAASRRRAAERGLRVVADLTCEARPADLGAQVRALRDARADVLISSGFSGSVPPLWRAIRADRTPLRGIVGISGWAFPRDDDTRREGFDGVFVVAAPYLYSADRSGLPAEARDLLEGWWRAAPTPPRQDMAVDRDLAYTAVHALLTYVLPAAASADPDELARVARALDVPLGGTPVGYGIRFDATGDNQHSYSIVMQWQGGRRVTVHPAHLANAAPVVTPLG